MPFTLTMPKLSPTMEEGAIAKWHKKVGEFVEAGDLLLEVSTDKATVEYNGIDSGWLRAILVKEGELAAVNQPIAIFTAEKSESIESYKPEGIAPVAAKAEPVAAAANTRAPEVQERPKGAAFQQPAFVPEAPLEQYAFERPTETITKRIPSSPLARKIAKEKGLDISTVKGSGPGNRIVSRDLELAQPSGAFAFGRHEGPTVKPGTYEEEALMPMRKVIAQRLQESKSFIPHFYVQQTVDAHPIIEVREQLSRMGVKVSFNDIVVRACALALRQHPNINSGFNSVNQTIIRFKTIDISIAATVQGGLITPIVRHADYKNLGELSAEIRQLVKQAKEGKLEPEEYRGGSFTVSNLGMYGVTNFQAIINPPQAAILAVGGIQDAPIVRNGAVVPGKIMNIALSADHRVVDGVSAAEFIKTVQKYLENPSILLI